MKDDHFKISVLIYSLILIAVWCFVSYWYVDSFYIKEFHLVILLSVPLYAFFSFITVVGGVSGIISQIEVLKKK